MVKMSNHSVSRLSGVTPALTLSISARANEMRAQGLDVCNFSAGRPEQDTPAHIKEAAKAALDAGHTKYGAVAGERALREAIQAKLKSRNALDYPLESIAITNGAKHALYNLMMVLLEPGDEVIIARPYWLSFPDMVRAAGGIPVFLTVNESTDFSFDGEMLEELVTDKTKALILNTPGNPTGAVFTKEQLQSIASVALKRGFWIVSDEIFESLIFVDKPHYSIASLCPEVADRTFTVSGFSKIYSMTGWRVGYVAGPSDKIRDLGTLQSHATSNVCSFAQYGSIAAYTDPRSDAAVEDFKASYLKNRDLMHAWLNSLPGVTAHTPESTFYHFANISKTGMSSSQYSNWLLEEYHIATVPGVIFGDDAHVRFSYAVQTDTVHRVARRRPDPSKSALHSSLASRA